MKNIEYVPKAITAKVGQTIHWTNGDSVAHTVTSVSGASFDSGVMDPGKEFSFKVTKAGTINYMCQIHPNQKGTIVVSLAAYEAGRRPKPRSMNSARCPSEPFRGQHAELGGDGPEVEEGAHAQEALVLDLAVDHGVDDHELAGRGHRAELRAVGAEQRASARRRSGRR